ncbi:hypothetical protein D9619_013637 [Psilocybe cf. subviscida]|uniref:Cytochrome P450 n=1 Tax=Psilocybe cf. subviscida TaxID=2480587 RepID=A0A8H5F8Y1_9AGAR|nr:hypothetical protein D9619_013637 [Psilocybe cf. subviscida]
MSSTFTRPMADNLTVIAALGLTVLSVAYLYHVRIVAPPESPNTPITVPYLIPWIGSFFSFNRDPLGFLEKCHLRYGRSYKICVAGRTVVIITDPDGVAFISRDTTNHLDHKAVFIQILRAMGGLGPESVDFIQDLLDTKIFPIVKTVLSPTSMSEVTDRIDLLLPRELKALSVANSPSISLNLSELIGRPIYNAGCRALFGPTFPVDSFHDFVELDSYLPQLLTRLPFIAQRGKDARLRMVSMLEKYFESWWDSDGTEDIPEASATVMQSLIELKASRVSRRDAAGTLLLFLWGFHSNMWFMIFWLLTHLVVDKTSMTRMVADIDEFEAKRTSDSYEYGPPVLEAAIQETLRWATTSTTARFATENTTVIAGGVPIPILKGEWVLGDIRAVHHNPSVYDDPHVFQIDRYAAGRENIPPAPKPFAWGQGKHMCPGRHVAVHVIRRFIVKLLTIYEVVPAKQSMENMTIPPISARHFLGSLKSTEDVPVVLFRRL